MDRSLGDRRDDVRRSAIGDDRAGDRLGFDGVLRKDHHVAAGKCNDASIRVLGAGCRDFEMEFRADAQFAGDADGAAHGGDDPLGNGEAEAGAAMLARRRAVGLFEFLENAIEIVGRDAGAGVAHREADGRLGAGRRRHRHVDQHAAAVGELDGVADQIEQQLAQATRVGRHDRRHVGRDVTADADAFGIGARRQQLDDVVGDLAHRDRLRLEFEAARLDLGIVEQILDQREQRAGRRRDGADIGVLLGRQLGVGQQLGHAHDAVHRRADLMADGGEEPRFRLACEFGALAGVDQRRLGALAGGDVARDGTVRHRIAGLVAHRQLDPRKPAHALRRADRDVGRAQAFAFGEGGVRNDADIDAELGKRAAGKVAGLDADKVGEDPVGVDDPAVAVAVHDKVAERVDQAAEAFFALLQLPHAVGQRLVLDQAAFGGGVDLGGKPALGAQGDRKQDQRSKADAEQRRWEIRPGAPSR